MRAWIAREQCGASDTPSPAERRERRARGHPGEAGSLGAWIVCELAQQTMPSLAAKRAV